MKYIVLCIKWLLAGAMCSFFVNIVDIWILFQNGIDIWLNVCFPTVSIIVCLIVVFIASPKKVKEWFIALIMVFIGNILLEQLLHIFGLYTWFYFKINPVSKEIAVGESLLSVVLRFAESIGILFGFIILFIQIILRYFKDRM